MITPSRILEISEPIERTYQRIVDELLINIGRHLRGNTTTWTAYWEVQKLAELGKLTEENAAIINKHIADMPQMLKDTMEETRKTALSRLEKQLEKAAEDGYVTPAVSDGMVELLAQYSAQAAEQLNLVNTTMLQSSLDQYQKAVTLTALIERQAEETQSILNTAAGKVLTGAETRQNALRTAIRQISKEGLSGFYDKAGRSWSPEAYVNMDIRTTVHNVAIQSIKTRMEDYNTTVFQVSSHAGARPLCYPYQGKYYSWDNTSGSIELGNGRTVDYKPLRSTSYGEAAGLFGINCGHYPIPIIPRVTIPHGADNIEPEGKNNKEYAESQEQRRLERNIRSAKRIIAMAGSLADKDMEDALKNAQQNMRSFIDETGRKRRYERERI